MIDSSLLRGVDGSAMPHNSHHMVKVPPTPRIAHIALRRIGELATQERPPVFGTDCIVVSFHEEVET